MAEVAFTLPVIELFENIMEDMKEFDLKRVNSAFFLKALFELEESPMYDAIIAQVGPECFPQFLDEIAEYLPEDEEELQEDEELSLKFAYDTEKYIIYFDEDMDVVLSLIKAYLDMDATLTIYFLTQFFVYAMPKPLLFILRTFGVNIKELKKTFGVDVENIEEASTFQIPKGLQGFVRNLNEEMKGTKCDIEGRERECKQVWDTLQKYSKSNAVLLGEPGVGKTSIVVKMVHDILDGNCPEVFKDFTVLSLDVASSVAGTKYRGEAEERFSSLVNYLENQPNVILFIDEIHLINGAGACREGEVDLANTLKPILAGGKVRVIGATTQKEYENYFSRDGALKRRFRPVYVKEPKMKEVYPMLKKSIKTLSDFHGVKISKEMVDFIILNASCFDNETCNPDRTKDLIDLAMVTAKQAGKTEVDKDTVLANFAYHLKQFNKMSNRAKRSTAYHEAGHCLVMLCSKELSNYDVMAVSIMPTDSYLGVTVYEPNETTPEPTMEYYIDSIAMDLAGRVAEGMYTKTITSGAYSDLCMATQKAHDIISKFGMADFGRNRNFTEETTSDKVKDRINEEIDKIINKAMARAEAILSVNDDSLTLLVNALMEKGIVGPNDLKTIMKDIVKM